MALDFYANTHAKLIASSPDSLHFAMQDEFHTQLFAYIKNYPQFKNSFHKFRDYYADSVVLFAEIQPLIQALDVIFLEQSRCQAELQQFRNFLNIAYQKSCNLYIYCD